PRLGGVRAAVEVASGDDVCVVEAKARGSRHERQAALPVRRDERRTLFGSAIDRAWDHLAMPVHELGRVGFVVDIDHSSLAFLEPQERAGELVVVERRGNDMVGCELNQTRSYA